MSKKSSVCLIEWRPSGWLCASLLVLGVLAAMSIGLSAMPAAMKWVLAPACLAHAVWLMRRHARQPATLLRICGHMLFVDAVEPCCNVSVQVRGPFAAVSAKDGRGRTRRWLWWPDTLPRSARRALRLAGAPQKIADSGPGLATMSG